MKKPLKILYIVFVVLLILIIAAFVIISLFADSAIKVAIETAGTKALNVGVSVDKVDLSILGGKLGFQNLIINNPPNYQHDKLLELNKADITVDIKSLLTDTVNINEIKLDGTKVVFEQRGVSGNNLQDIIKQLPEKQEQTSEPSGKKLHIDNLVISNTQVQIKLMPIPGKFDTIPMKLSTIEMKDLGGDDNLDTVTLSRTILLAIAGGIAEQGADILPKEMLGSLVSELMKVGGISDILLDSGIKILGTGADIGKGAADVGGNVGKGVIKGVGDVGKGITEGLTGILQPKKEDEEE